MRNEAGFSLIEIVIAILLLGIIATSLTLFANINNNPLKNRNVAEMLAESQIETCHNTPYTNLANTNFTSSITTNGVAVNYNCQVTIAGRDLNAVTKGTTYDINTLLITPVDALNPDLKIVTVQISADGGVVLAQRTALIPRP